ncbi:cupredoxin domain-containing protein [Candidatus Pacearchaeota archaeon]|nr:cupredoxin domain-containing protein [Candidatus Pacearchaeota archaeon]
MKTGMIITIFVIAVVLIGGIVFFMMKNSNYSNPADNARLDTNNPSSGIDTNTNTNDNSQKTYNVNIRGFAFSLSTITINAGDTVIWTNNDPTGHTVTSDSGSELSSSTLSKGNTYSHTFNTAGTYSYHCTPHPGMKAKVIVR